MNTVATPAERAAALVAACRNNLDGQWFVRLEGEDGTTADIGPYQDAAAARHDATKIQRFVASILREAERGEPRDPGRAGDRLARLKGRDEDSPR